MKMVKQRIAVSFLIITAMIMTLFPATAFGAVAPAGTTKTVKYRATSNTPLETIDYTYQTDGKFKMKFHFDISIYQGTQSTLLKDATKWRVIVMSDNGDDADATYYANHQGDLYDSNGKLQEEVVVTSDGRPNVAPNSNIKIRLYFVKSTTPEVVTDQYNSFIWRKITTPAAPTVTDPGTGGTGSVMPSNPGTSTGENLLQKHIGYTRVEKSDGQGNEWKDYYADFVAKSEPSSGEFLWAVKYEKSAPDKTPIYGGPSTTNRVQALVYGPKNKIELTETEESHTWAVVSAKTAAEAKTKALKIFTNGKGSTFKLEKTGIISSCMPYAPKSVSQSSRLDGFTANVQASTYGTAVSGTTFGLDVYNYTPGKGEGTLYKTYPVTEKDYWKNISVSGMLPGTSKTFSFHPYRIDIDGTRYESWDGRHYTFKSLDYTASSISVVKQKSGKVRITVKIPTAQAVKGVSKVYVYRCNSLIKSFTTTGKSSVSFTYNKKNAIKYKYKVKTVYGKKTSINKTSAAKGASTNQWTRPGFINPNIDKITKYRTATFVPWKLSYYNGKMKVTGYIVNNRVFKLKKYKFNVKVTSGGKSMGSKTVTYKNIKPYAKKKVTITIKTKKYPDFVNASRGWKVKNKSTKW